MNILVASEGSSLEHRVAAKFAGAAWYLVVDVDTLEATVLPRTAFDNRHEVIVRAAALGAGAVVTGHIGPAFLHQLLESRMMLASAHGVSVLEAVQRYRQGVLKVLGEADLRALLEEHRTRPAAVRGGGVKKGRTSSTAFDPVTPRGRHHLQQYSGRGR
jgi:predicted Fe-Mo cluster-binding NifX family protein